MNRLWMAEWRRLFIEMARYPMETVSAMVTLFLIFAGLFIGASYISNSPLGGGKLATVVLGYGVWMIMMAATSDMGYSIQNEAQNGTLEQVMLVPWSALSIFVARAAASIVNFLVPAAVVVWGLIALTGVHLEWSGAAAVPAVMTLFTAWGLGLVVAAAALVLKRIGQMLQIVNFLLLFVILAPVTEIAGLGGHILSAVVPFTAQVALLHTILGRGVTGGATLWQEAVVNMLVWAVGGGLVFTAADRIVRRRGTLSHY